MSEIVVETMPQEVVIEIDNGPALTTTIASESQTIVETPATPVVIDLNSGARGEPGPGVLVGPAYPTMNDGSVGDIYIVTEGDVAVGNVYTKHATEWVHTGNVRGPSGGIDSVNGYTHPDVILTKADIGLNNVDNTSDLNKPISTATQNALDQTVKVTGDQTIAGNKTFTDIVSVSNAKLRIGTSTTPRYSLIADASGYASWGNPALIAANKPETDNANTYAQGVYIQPSDSPSPWTEQYGVVLTAFQSAERAWQLMFGKSGSLPRIRAAEGTGTNGWRAWVSLADDSKVVHNTGNETIAGSKTFSGSVNAAGLTAGGMVLNGSMTIAHPAGNSSIEIGRVDGVANTPFIDFHAGATVTDYDARIIVNTGNGTNGGGGMSITAATVSFSGTISGNGSGLTALNGSQVTTGTIADARLSTNVALKTGATFSGAVIVPAPSADTHASTKKYVDDQIFLLTNGSPAMLNTLDELAAALGDDPNFATTVTNQIATKEPIINTGPAGTFYRSDKTWAAPTPAQVGLGNVTNDQQVTTQTAQSITGYKTFSNDTYFTALIRATANTRLETQTDWALGQVAGDIQITRQHNHVGGTNVWKIVDMMHRRAAGNDWAFAQMYTGVGIDTSFLASPTTGTSGTALKTWIRRDPQNNTIGLGSGIAEYLTLTSTAVTVGSGVVFTGNGSGLTTLNGTNISSGTVADARLSSNVALLGGSQTFSGAKTFSARVVVASADLGTTYSSAPLEIRQDSTGVPRIAFHKAGVTAAQIRMTDAGVFEFANIGNDALSPIAALNITATGAFTGNGYGLTNLNANNLAQGTVAPARLGNAVVRVNHGSTAGTARPAGVAVVQWYGSVAPTNAAANDEWIKV